MFVDSKLINHYRKFIDEGLAWIKKMTSWEYLSEKKSVKMFSIIDICKSWNCYFAINSQTAQNFCISAYC